VCAERVTHAIDSGKARETVEALSQATSGK
jgi:hypothetical protein